MRKGLPWLTLGFAGLLLGTPSCGEDEAVGDPDTVAVDACEVCTASGECRKPSACIELVGSEGIGVCAEVGETACCTDDNSVCRSNLSGDTVEGGGGTSGRGGGGSGGSILGGSSGTAGRGGGGSGGTASVNTTALGAPCQDDGDCDDDRMICLTSDGLDDGSGPPGGLCTLPCTSDGQCLEITDSSFCASFTDTERYCIESCLTGTFNEPKCHEREDTACTIIGLDTGAGGDDCDSSEDCPGDQLCSTDGTCGEIVTACSPTCGGDFHCDSGVCDFRSGFCTDAKPDSLLPIGSPCVPPSGNEDEPCDGFCVPTNDEETEGECQAFCLQTETAVGCGFDGSEPAEAGCLFGTIISPPDSAGGRDVGLGDVMICGKMCDCNEQCPLDGDYCVDESGDNALVFGTFGRNGYCRQLLDGETEADTFIQCPDGSGGGSGTGGAAGAGGEGTSGTSGTSGGGGEGGEPGPAGGQGGQGGAWTQKEEGTLTGGSAAGEETGAQAFLHGSSFAAGEVSGGFAMGPLELQYEELFAEALEDGIITSDERLRLEKAAENLGIARDRLLRLEQAMVAAYESRHRVQIVEHYEEPAASLSPLRVEAEGDAGRALLLKRIEQLEARVQELETELRRAQAAINVEVDLSGLESEAARASEDPEDCWRRIRRNPTDPEAHRQLRGIYAARGERDRAWCVAQCLVALGAANGEEQAEFEAHRAETLMVPRAGLSQTAWYDQLFHPEEEVLTGQIFSVIAPAVLLGRVTALRRDGKLHQPKLETRQDPAKATVTAVRAIPWAAAILGLPQPNVFVERERDDGYEHVPGVPPMTVIGKRVLSGRTQLEHAFLVGRHLSFYRNEHFVKTLFSAVPDLEDLFLAALVIGNPGLPIAEDMKRRVTPIANAIQPLLEPAQVDRLRGCFLRFVEEGGRTNLQRWALSTEKTACRAGFLLSNDLGTALRLLEAEERGLGELGKDLLAFATSERYFQLRRQLGIAIA